MSDRDVRSRGPSRTVTALLDAVRGAEDTGRLGVLQGADLVVVGSGIAGLTAAITAVESSPDLEVALVTKTALGGGSSPWAQGGIAAAVGGAADAREHAEDTLRVGRGLADVDTVSRLTGLGADAVEWLLARGVRFDRDDDGALLLGREGGHRRRRVLHAAGDATGREIMRALGEHFRDLVVDHPRVTVVEHFLAEDLLVVEDGRAGEGRGAPRVVGVVGRSVADDAAPDVATWVAPRTLLATGGMGQLFLHTTNPAEVTGDGIAMAARAGALLADLEMVQFHPTTLDVRRDGGSGSRDADPRHAGSRDAGPRDAGPRDAVALLTEALRGEGALLLDEDGRRFMTDVHELAELAPRDVVARELWRRSTEGRASYLDLRPVHEALLARGSSLAERFPTAVRHCRAAGLDPLLVPVPVAPAAHYTMGGVWTRGAGRTSLPGLWACGEVASSGVHGANRLASNSLLEGVVFGREVTLAALAWEPAAPTAGCGTAWRVGDEELASARPDRPWRRDPSLRRLIQRRMWEDAGLVRDADGLRALDAELAGLGRFRRDVGGEERNLLLLGRLLCASALRRTESRGAHHRADHPDTDPGQARRILATAAELLDLRGGRGEGERERIVRSPAASAVGGSLR